MMFNGAFIAARSQILYWLPLVSSVFDVDWLKLFLVECCRCDDEV